MRYMYIHHSIRPFALAGVSFMARLKTKGCVQFDYSFSKAVFKRAPFLGRDTLMVHFKSIHEVCLSIWLGGISIQVASRFAFGFLFKASKRELSL